MWRYDGIYIRKNVQKTYTLINMGIFISFVGWCFEKISRYAVYGSVSDRGFLTLPLCPIYGISIVSIFLLFGAPSKPTRNFLNKKPLVKYVLYFICVTLISTAAELVTGLVAKKFGVTLWDYSERAFNLWGVVCPSFSLMWGGLITAFMGILWRPLFNLFSKIPHPISLRLALTLSIAVTADFFVNLALTLSNMLSM